MPARKSKPLSATLPPPTTAENAQQVVAAELAKRTAPPVSETEAIALMIQYVNTPKVPPAVLGQLERAFRDYPNLWRGCGDLSLQAQHQLIARSYGTNTVPAEAAKRGIDVLAKELGRKDAPLLEQLLIDQVIVCWLQLYDTQSRYTQQMGESITLTLGMYWEKRLSVAQSRYLRATETLARVRRLAQPTPLQVNIGGQQVNVAGGLTVATAPPAIEGEIVEG